MAKRTNKGPINSLVQRLIQSIDPDKISDLNITERGDAFKKIINSELELTKGISDGSIVDFSRSLNAEVVTKRNPEDKWGSPELTGDVIEYINKNTSSMFQDFAENERNRYIQYNDYNFISKFVPKIGQALRMILTHIVSSDDLTNTFKRQLEFGSLDADDVQTLKLAIEKFEKENKLLYKLENLVYKNTLIMGEYYVYAISYKDLFTNYARLLAKKREASGKYVDKKNKKSMGYAMESFMIDDDQYKTLESAYSTTPSDGNVLRSPKSQSFRDDYGSGAIVTCYDSEIPFIFDDDIASDDPDLYEKKLSTALEAVERNMSLQKTKVKVDGVADGTYGLGGSYDVAGTYIKFISARNIAPVEVLGNIVGYFYVSHTTIDKAKKTVSIGNIHISSMKKRSPIEDIAKSMVDKISQKFSDKFVSANTNYKRLIADCIMAAGVTNTEYKVQFIPAENVIHFKVDDDENSRGQSIMKDAIQPAKTLAAVNMRKVLNYLNKSGDKTVMTVRGGNADYSRKNQAMRIIRNMQEQNIVVSDLLGDCNNIFHKYAADGNIMMPTSRTGQKLVELEKMDGQQIDMNVEWEKEQENEILTAMGVPPLLLDTHLQADFARAFTTAHVGFAGTIAKWDGDLETPTTQLYKIIIQNLDISDELKTRVLPVFSFKLPRPKFAATQTGVESIQQGMQMADHYIQLKYGESPDESMKDVIREVKFAIVRENCATIPWEKYDEIAKKIEMEYVSIKDDVKDTGMSSDTDSGMDEF